MNEIKNYEFMTNANGSLAEWRVFRSSCSYRHTYYGQYIKISGYREFKIPGGYCYLKESNLGNVYVTSSEGLFKEENGRIRQLYWNKQYHWVIGWKKKKNQTANLLILLIGWLTCMYRSLLLLQLYHKTRLKIRMIKMQ